jgi:magnesium chelatase family protein
MSLAVVLSRGLAGLEAPLVTVEVHLSGGLPAFNLVGLPETEVKESRDRVRAALQNAQFEFPARKITVNLAPADLPKESGRFDLPIALGVLAATGQLPAPPLATHEFAGELALTGALRPIRGALPMALSARRDGRAFVLPTASAGEAALVRDATVYPAATLLAVCAHIAGREALAPLPPPIRPAPGTDAGDVDLADVRGQPQAKRALAIAAAGAHSLLILCPNKPRIQAVAGIDEHAAPTTAVDPRSHSLDLRANSRGPWQRGCRRLAEVGEGVAHGGGVGDQRTRVRTSKLASAWPCSPEAE